MQESSGSIDIKEERKLIPEKNVEVMPVRVHKFVDNASTYQKIE